jgi:hypothetical protein
MSILKQIDAGIASIQKAGNLRISRIEIGSVTYYDLMAELSPTPKEIVLSAVRYREIPVERIEYDKGVFLRVEIQ